MRANDMAVIVSGDKVGSAIINAVVILAIDCDDAKGQLLFHLYMVDAVAAALTEKCARSVCIVEIRHDL